MTKVSNPYSIVDLAALGIIIVLVWMCLYLVALAVTRAIRKDKSPFLKSLMSLRTLGFLIFSVAMVGFACFQIYEGSKG